MNIGDIILIPFPFAKITKTKVRPAVVITETEDKYRDLVVSAISSVVPEKLSEREFLIVPGELNQLRTKSIVKVDRIVTVKRENIIAKLGKLSNEEINIFKSKLIRMIH
jgi:mRNA-degrading endonuclease toxin of MazEF toxin-antitoxin module